MADVVIYARVSSWQQAKGHGLERQLEKCMQYASDRGHVVCAVFSEVRSAKEEYIARQQAEKMARTRNGYIVCEAVDRWTRKGASDIPPNFVLLVDEWEAT